MLHIPNIEEIHGALLKAPRVLTLFDRNDPLFVKSTRDWLEYVEHILQQNRHPACAQIAGIRARVISTERGLKPDDMVFLKRVTKHRAVHFAAERAISEAVQVVTNAIAKDIDRVSNAEAGMREIVILGRRIGLLKPEDTPTNTTPLSQVWEDMKVDDGSPIRKAIAERAISVETFVGKRDSLILLDRILSTD